ncbi:MAG: HNH endonuclease signature motif containing protein [Pseudomonadota bacterium]
MSLARKGINIVPAKLADGEPVFYYYSRRKGGKRFWQSPDKIDLTGDLPRGFRAAYERAVGLRAKRARQRYNGREITPSSLRELLSYNRDTGELVWRYRAAKWFHRHRDYVAWNRKYADRQAFTAVNGDGYLHGNVHGRTLLAHRVAYAIHYGEWPNHIDHINHVTTDNRLENIRSVTQAENNRNRRLTPKDTAMREGTGK